MNTKYIEEIKLKETLNCEDYIKNLAVIKNLTEIESLKLTKNVTFLVGENGTGKSTLIEAIAIAFGFNAEGGSKNFNFNTFNSFSNLYKDITLVKKGLPKDGYFLRAESFFNVASNIEKLAEESGGSSIINYYGGKSLHNQSHGESFISLIQNRFYGNGLYILDEPEAALSPNKLLLLLAEINKLEKNNSQFIIATHSPILLTYPNAEIFELSENGIESVNYKDTEHYITTKNFLENPERTLHYLFEE